MFRFKCLSLRLRIKKNDFDQFLFILLLGVLKSSSQRFTAILLYCTRSSLWILYKLEKNQKPILIKTVDFVRMVCQKNARSVWQRWKLGQFSHLRDFCTVCRLKTENISTVTFQPPSRVWEAPTILNDIPTHTHTYYLPRLMRFHKSFLAGEHRVSCFARSPKPCEDSTFVIKYRFYISARRAVFSPISAREFSSFYIYGAIYCCIVSGERKKRPCSQPRGQINHRFH